MIIVFLLSHACKAQDKIQTKGESKAQDKVQNSNWLEFTSEEANFKVKFPEEPRKSVKEFDTPNGKGQRYDFKYVRSNPELNFFVNSSDMPSIPNMNDEFLKTNYDFVQDGIIEAQNARLLNQKDIYINKYLGREITFEVLDTIIKSQMYLFGNRQYQIIVSTKTSLAKDKETMASIEKFLNSFEPLKY